MDWRLSFDLGTNSLGWAALEIKDREPVSILDMGVRIFPDGREPAAEGRVGDPLNLARREARSTRKIRYRKDVRHKEVANILAQNGLIPAKNEDNKAFHRINPYEARYKAAHDLCTPEVLGRALLNISFHRGFKSNRKDADAKDSSKRLKEIEQLRETLGKQTLGEYLWEESKGKIAPKFRFRGDKNIFPDRAMLEDEFHKIKEAQSQNTHLNTEFWQAVKDAIFFQRPLKPQERGLCTYLYQQKEPRAFKAQPSAERYRIWSEINNLKWIDSNLNMHELSDKQRNAIAQKLLTTASDVKFSTLLTLKEGKQKLFEDAQSFNLESEHRDKINAAPVLSKVNKIISFTGLSDEEQDDIILLLIEEADENKLISQLTQKGFTSDDIEQLLKIKLPSGVVSLSAKFIRAITPILIKEPITYDKAVPLAGKELGLTLHHSQFYTGEVYDELPYYGAVLTASVVGASYNLSDPDEIRFGRIANPTVHVALNQLRRVVNALVARFGRPSEIVVEIARELKQTREARDNIMKIQKVNLETKKRCDAIMKDAGCNPDNASGQDYKKFRLWEELGKDQVDRRCPFSGKQISQKMLFTGAVQIEHILPYKRTLDNSFNNLTLAIREANMFKGDKTPYEAFGNDQAVAFSEEGKSDWSWAAIKKRVSHLPLAKQNRFSDDSMDDFMAGAGSEFLVRQATDNAYIARISKQYLSYLIDPNKVWTVKGALTEKIRGQWFLNNMLSDDGFNKKNRTDHRHHAIDAFVLGMTDRRFMQKVTALVNKNDGKLTSPLPPLDENLRIQLEDKLQNMIISYKPDHGLNGKFYNETAYGFVRDVGRDNEYADYNLVYRKSIESLTAKMVTHIRDVHIRNDILAYIDEPQNSNKKLADILAEYSQNTGIKKLRILEKNDSVKPIQSADYKGYSAAGYAYVDIWQIPKKGGKFEYKGMFISFYDAMQKDDLNISRPKPHPAAKYIMRLFKDDMVELEGEIYKVFGYSASQNKIDIEQQYISQKSRKQKFKSINQLIPKGLKKLNITPDGQKR